MFESVTKKRKNPFINIFGWFLLSVVCVVFVFIGFSPNSGFLNTGGAAAEVNGEAISRKDFKELVDRLSRNGDQSGQQDRSEIGKNAINMLINRILVTQTAGNMNIFVGNNEVVGSLMDIQAFYEDGVFSRLRYKTVLKQIRLTESEFEDKTRQDLLMEKMMNLVGFVSRDTDFIDEFDETVDQAQINVGYVLLNPEKIKPSSGEVQSFLENNHAEAEKYYKNHKNEFTVSEQVKVRHILIKAKDETKESFDEALKKINDIVAKIQLDQFSDMAKKHSDDPGSRDKGGDLGFFGRGQMVPEFEKAAFSAPLGKITGPVKTKYGYHILLVDEKKEAGQKSFDEVKNEIALKLQSKNQYDQLLERIKTHLKDKSFGDLEAFLGENNLKWSETGYFGIIRENIPGIGSNKEFLDKAMGLGSHRQYPDSLVYKGNKAYLIKFKGVKMDSLSEENAQMNFFKQLMKRQKSNLMFQSWTKSLREKASIKINPRIIR